jgi:hypothetical protein
MKYKLGQSCKSSRTMIQIYELKPLDIMVWMEFNVIVVPGLVVCNSEHTQHQHVQWCIWFCPSSSSDQWTVEVVIYYLVCMLIDPSLVWTVVHQCSNGYGVLLHYLRSTCLAAMQSVSYIFKMLTTKEQWTCHNLGYCSSYVASLDPGVVPEHKKFKTVVLIIVGRDLSMDAVRSWT